MELIEPIVALAFLVLLAASIYMLVSFYICDSHNCQAFKQAEREADKGTTPYIVILLEELCSDGMWPFPYIGASILTPLALWFVGTPITVRNFAIVFFVSFTVVYCLFAFFSHHYVKVITSYCTDQLESQ